jgi:GAF domain-containing protein
LNRETLDERTDDLARLGAEVEGILRELRQRVPFDSASVQELRGGRLVIVGGVGFEQMEPILGESFDIHNNDNPNGEVVYRRRPLIVSDTENYRAFRRGLHVGAGIRSWLGVPLLLGEHLFGMIALDKKEPDYYHPEHERLALTFATRTAEAMARFRS